MWKTTLIFRLARAQQPVDECRVTVYTHLHWKKRLFIFILLLKAMHEWNCFMRYET